MTHGPNNFSTTDIHKLENGLRWIKEAQERFGIKLYHRLMRELPEARLFLHSMSPRSFSKNIVQSLDDIIGELRSQGDVISPLKKFWPELSSPLLDPLEPSELIKVTETFLDLVSELAEDTWSPALENAWRKAINALMPAIERTGSIPFDSFARPQSTPHLFNKQGGLTRTQPTIGYVAPVMLIAGGMVAFGLWMHCQLGKMGLKARKPFQFSVCS